MAEVWERWTNLISTENGFSEEEIEEISKYLSSLLLEGRTLNSSLGGSFHWNGTPQGHRYWSDLNKKLYILKLHGKGE